MQEVVFIGNMIEPKSGFWSVSVIVLILLAVIISVLGLVMLAKLKNTSLSLTSEELIIKSSLFTKKIPLQDISIDEIKKLNLDENPYYKLSLRTFGVGMPNMNLGWFRLKNKTKALAFVTDKKSVVLIPTKEYSVIFSMKNIDEFIEKIREVRKG